MKQSEKFHIGYWKLKQLEDIMVSSDNVIKDGNRK